MFARVTLSLSLSASHTAAAAAAASCQKCRKCSVRVAPNGGCPHQIQQEVGEHNFGSGEVVVRGGGGGTGGRGGGCGLFFFLSWLVLWWFLGFAPFLLPSLQSRPPRDATPCLRNVFYCLHLPIDRVAVRAEDGAVSAWTRPNCPSLIIIIRGGHVLESTPRQRRTPGLAGPQPPIIPTS